MNRIEFDRNTSSKFYGIDMKYVVYLVVLIGCSLVRAGSYEDFFVAVRNDDGNAIRTLIRQGFDANVRDPKGEHALHLAARDNAAKAVAALLQWDKLDVEPRNKVDEIPPEIARQIMQDHLDQHYRETLDAPIPALGGKSPRQAVRTAAGRVKVIDWLKMLENRSAKHGEGPIAEYDFGWMWVELGLQEHHR